MSNRPDFYPNGYLGYLQSSPVGSLPPPCLITRTPDVVTAAEILLGIAQHINYKEGILVASRPMEDWELTRVKLALKFVALGPGTVFRAIVEEWSPSRIVREVY